MLFLPDSPSFSARIQALCLEMGNTSHPGERISARADGFLGSGGFARFQTLAGESAHGKAKWVPQCSPFHLHQPFHHAHVRT